MPFMAARNALFGSRFPSHSSVKRIIRIVGIGKGLPVFLILSLQFFPGVGQDKQLYAQVQPGFDPTGRFGEPPPLEKKTEPLPPKPAPDITLPPVETIPELKGAPPQIRVMIRKIQVEGSTVFSAEELAKVTAPYENRELSTNDLEELRRALTLLYVNKGYVNSGAVIPDQTLQNGVVTIQIIEGKLTDIQIEGTKYFLPFYFEDRIALSSGPPLNINPLKEKLQLLLQDPRTERLNTELKPGLKPGEGVLHVQVEEASPFNAWIEFNNFQSPTVGESRGLGNIAVQNPFGLGDAFRFTYGQSKGLQPLIEANYIIPLTARDTTLELNFRFNDFNVVTKPFDDLDIKTKSQIYKIALRQPVYRTLNDEVALSLIGEHLENQSFLGGTGFSFQPGATSNGKAIVSALRFGQEWIHRESNQVLAVRSRFSVGLNVLDATNNKQNSDDPDGEFFVWLGQAQYVRRVDPLGIEFLGGLTLQIANDSLFALEQFAVGGRYSVRGYWENYLVRDNAFLFNLESRIPMFPDFFGPKVSVALAPFIDVGRSWEAKRNTPDPQTLASIGTGIRLSFFNRAHASLYWGQQLNHVQDPPDGGVQDQGIHWEFVLDIL